MRRLTVCIAVALAGCGTHQYPLSEAQNEELTTPVICHGADACGKLWRKAQIWVSEHAAYKIQVATDAVIETYNAPIYSSGWAMKLVRIPRAGDAEELQLTLSCGQVPLCSASPEKMQIRFKRDIRE